MLGGMNRFAWLAVVALAACSSTPVVEAPKPTGAYAGTIEKVFRVVRKGADLPGAQFLGRVGAALGSALRRNAETLQYIVRTPRGQVIAQSDEEFAVGACVEVIPQADHSGPAFRYGEAAIVPSQACSG